jgi:hypothetical protein
MCLFSSPFPSGTAGPSGYRCLCGLGCATITSAPLDFQGGPGVGLQTHTAVFAAVATATITAVAPVLRVGVSLFAAAATAAPDKATSDTAESAGFRLKRGLGRANVACVSLDFRNGPGIGLLAHSAVFAAVAIATIAEGVSTTEVEVQAIRATCAAFAVVASVTTGVSLDSYCAVCAGVNQAHAAFSGVSIWTHRAVFVIVVAVAAAASAATTARACVACTARHAEVALARHIGKSMGASRSGLLGQKGQVRLLLRLGYFAGATTAAAAVRAAAAIACTS